MSKVLSHEAMSLMAVSHTAHDKISWNALWDYIAELEAMVEQLIWVGNDLLIDNANPVTVVLFNGLVAKAKEKEREE